MAHNSSILLDLQTSSSARSLLRVAGFPPLAFQATTNCAAQAQAMERIVVGENVSRVPRYKLDKKAKTVKTTKEPGDEVPDILERLRAIKSGRCSSSKHNKEKRVKQSQNIADSKSSSTDASAQCRLLAKFDSHKPMLPSDDVTLLPQPTQAFRYPESMEHLPRLTPHSFRQHIRNQGLEGVFVEFVPFANLSASNPIKRHKEHLEKHGIADCVEWVVP
ncbi:hypothetical protein KCU98_g8857, partial [Aureobasidium melanogenum]